MANQVGKNIKYYDGSTWKTGKDVTEADIKEYINYLYEDEAFPAFVNRYPSYFQKTSLFNSWIATGTADAGLSGSTLVATGGIFTNSMANERLKVYNSTDGESATITAFTSSTTVTVDNTDISGWSGDTLYVLGQEFSFGGDGTDLWTVDDVEVKYTDSATRYTAADRTERENIYVRGDETGNKISPFWYTTTIDVSGTLTSAIGVFPKFDNKVTNAIRVIRTAKPGDMGDSDRPRLPVSKPLIDGATAWAWEQRGNLKHGQYYMAKYERGLALALQNWRPDRSNTPRKMKVARKRLDRRFVYRR